MTDNQNHNEDGKFVAGNNANPTGKNGQNKGWQPFSQRIQKWLALSGLEIRELIEDPQKLETLSSIDIACIRQVAGMVSNKDSLTYLEAALDRIEGKAKQTVKHLGDSEEPVVFTLNIGDKDVRG